MANKKMIPLRNLALTASAAYRTKTVIVPEWENAAVKLREPSGASWVKSREYLDQQLPENGEGDDKPKPSAAQVFTRNKMADVILFVDVLLGEDGEPVFSEADIDVVASIYGQVHARLLRQALSLSTTQEYAEKK